MLKDFEMELTQKMVGEYKSSSKKVKSGILNEHKDDVAEIETFEKLQKFVKYEIHYYNYERRRTNIDL